MKQLIRKDSEWNNHRSVMEATGKAGIGSFLGHLGEPQFYPSYVVSYKEIQDNMDFHIRHVFVSAGELHPPVPSPPWRAPLLLGLSLVFLGLLALLGTAAYKSYNPPPVAAQVQECQTQATKDFEAGKARLEKDLSVCQKSLEKAEEENAKVVEQECDAVLAKKRAELLKKIRVESYEILTLDGNDYMDDDPDCY